MNVFVAYCVLSVGLAPIHDAPDWPMRSVQINDQPVQLIADTGSSRLAVWPHAADRIALRYTKPPQKTDPSRGEAGHLVTFLSDACRWKIGNVEEQGQVRIWDMPSPLAFRLDGVDGVVGWSELSRDILHIDWGQRVFESLPKVPSLTVQWRSFDLYSASGVSVLAVQVPGQSGSARAVYIDTGGRGGVFVASAVWNEIVSKHPKLPMTVERCYGPDIGYHVKTIRLLKVLKLGDIELRDVLVSEAPQAYQQKPSYLATIGLDALTQLEVIVDSKQGRAYIRRKEGHPTEHGFNRAGVAFLPPDTRSADLVATVIETGPAYKAGIRNGDKLLQANGEDMTDWQADPKVMTTMDSLLSAPAGTKLTLTVRRGTRRVQAEMVLADLLATDPTPALY